MEPRRSSTRRAGRVEGVSGGVTRVQPWRHSRRHRCGFFRGRESRKCPAPTPWHAWTAGAAALRAGRRRAPLYAIDATRHKFRHQPELRRAAPRPTSPTRPLRLRVRILQPRPVARRPSASVGGRDRTISAARIRSGLTPGSCTRASPLFASVARFDPSQAGQTLNHGFPRWPVQKPSFRKK